MTHEVATDTARDRTAQLIRIPPSDRALVAEHGRYCDRRNLSEKTIQGRLAAIARLAEFCAPTPLLEVSAEQIERHFDARRGNRGGTITPGSRRAAASNLRSFYKWAQTFGHATTNPVDQVIVPKMPRRLPRPISEADYRAAVSDAPTAVLRCWLLLGGAAGLRCGELAALRWADVDLDAAELWVIDGKGGRDRVVPLVPSIVEALTDLLARADDPNGPVFVDSVFGRPFAPSYVSRQISLWFSERGHAITGHQLRHRFATEAYQATGDLRVVQELCGHASVETTTLYTEIRGQSKRAAVESMRQVEAAR